MNTKGFLPKHAGRLCFLLLFTLLADVRPAQAQFYQVGRSSPILQSIPAGRGPTLRARLLRRVRPFASATSPAKSFLSSSSIRRERTCQYAISLTLPQIRKTGTIPRVARKTEFPFSTSASTWLRTICCRRRRILSSTSMGSILWPTTTTAIRRAAPCRPTPATTPFRSNF